MLLPGCEFGTDVPAPTGDVRSIQKAEPSELPAVLPVLADVIPHMTPDQLAVGKPAVNTIGMLMVPIPAGEFVMGSQEPRHGLCRPVHQVTLSEPFFLGACEVTQEHYTQVMGRFASRFDGLHYPVANVNWNDAVEFCRRLSELKEEQAAGHVYRLPTEAEWEYACRAGTETRYSFGDDEMQLSEYGWFLGNAELKMHPVGQKKPNVWGLYDMHGNVWEWCQDWYGPYTPEVAVDPVGPRQGTVRVDRGGGWAYEDWYCESAIRGWLSPDLKSGFVGFRVARDLVRQNDR